MMMDDRRDLIAAFAIGAVVGVGAALLLSPEQPTGARRLLRQIEPTLKQARKKSRRLKQRARRRIRYR
jgi:gas vesicle protein